MNAAEHRAEAERLREQAAEAQRAAYDDRSNLFARWNAEYFNAAAQVHATLATLPDPPPVDPPADPLWDSPLYAAASLLERLAVGGDGVARERFLANVVLGQVLNAGDLAVHAMHAAAERNPAVLKAVEAAIATLGISTDAD